MGRAPEESFTQLEVDPHRREPRRAVSSNLEEAEAQRGHEVAPTAQHTLPCWPGLFSRVRFTL